MEGGCYPGIDEASQIRFRPMRTRFVCSLAPGTRVWDPPGTVRVWCSARVREDLGERRLEAEWDGQRTGVVVSWVAAEGACEREGRGEWGR